MHLAAADAEQLASTLRGRKRSLVLAGTAALALAGAASASIATASTATASTTTASTTSASTTTASTATASTATGTAPAPRAAVVVSFPVPYEARTVAATMLPRSTASHAARRPPSQQDRVLSWTQVRNAINQATDPASARRGILPPAGQLMPAGTAGPQVWMPISPAQLANATTIVRQALDKRMGIRSAVIAVATAMQESQLLNLHYGDLDSLGLFQQRPSMGWGTAAQVTDPGYAADAFLGALRQHQASDPAWAREPLWASAQAVQKSGFPLAYARWESQAAGLVKQIATSLQ
jgi:hypothetical protein